MRRKLFMSVGVLLLVLSLTGCVIELDNAGGMLSKAAKESTESVALADGYDADAVIRANLGMKAARADIGRTPDKLAEGSFRYNPAGMKPEFIAGGDKIEIYNKSSKFSLSKAVNQWDVKLTDRLPLDLNMDVDASDASIDLSGMGIAGLEVGLKASSARFYFDKPNRETIKELDIGSDASTASFYGLGNGGFEELAVKAKASRLVLDLTGEYKRSGKVTIDADASTVKLKLPEDIGVRILVGRYDVSTVNINNGSMLSRSNREYISRNYDTAGRTLEINLDMNITTLTVE